jgi:hypothetical protein
MESNPVVIAGVVPEGAQIPASGQRWMTAVLATAWMGRVRADRWLNVVQVVKALMTSCNYSLMTARPGWRFLMERTGLSRSTVASILADLHKHGCLATVATGRSATYQVGHVGQVREADQAVYVLCAPTALLDIDARTVDPESVVVALDDPGPVDETRTPRDLSSKKNIPTHAREDFSRTEPLRGTEIPAPTALAESDSLREAGLLAPSAPKARRAGRRAILQMRSQEVASEVRARIPVLRAISVRHVASVIRPFVAEGWSAADVVHAVDWNPGGQRWPHDGAKGVRRVDKWLAYRLVAWIDESGTPMASRAQTVQATAQARAQRHREEARQAAVDRAASNYNTPDVKALITSIRQQIRTDSIRMKTR